jgi:hypothetical protein
VNTVRRGINTGVCAAALLAGMAARGAVPTITNITMVPRLTIQSPIGITNQIQYSTNLSQTNWVVLTNLVVTEKQYWFVDVAAPPWPQRFYQVVVPSHTSTYITVTLKQLWGSASRTNSVTNLIQSTSIPTPVNAAAAAFDATHSSIWIPMSYVPAWNVGTLVHWGSSPYSMRVNALASDQIQFNVVTGGYFGWPAGKLIVTGFDYSLSTVITAAASWTNPGVGNLVQVSASAVTGSIGDVVWVGGVGGNQFQIISISR